MFDQDINVPWAEYNLLQLIKFGVHFNQNIYIWPPNLLILIFGLSFNRNLINLPSSLQVLSIKYYNLLSVRTLILDYSIIKTTSIDIFADTINTLIINNEGYNYSNIIFPKYLRVLILGKKFNQVINLLPSSLNILCFGTEFNQDLSTVIMPPSLNVITFGSHYTYSLHDVQFHEISIINDYTCRININFCKFPKSLHKIVHYERSNIDLTYNPVVIYNRPIGQFTKASRL
jgi:hypothetical protein